nr:hypothetical protein [Tanacetum cinerariifolium]
MQRFLRLAGFLGTAAGTEEEQAKNFQWGLRRSTLNHLMCMSCTDVAQVANAAHNYEILHERDDEDTERPDKRQRSGDRHQPTSQQSSHRSHGHNNDRYGSGRRGDTKESVVELQDDKKPGASGHVFAITEGQAANTSSTITGTLFIYGHAVIKGVKMEKRNIQDMSVLSIDDHRAFNKRIPVLPSGGFAGGR